MKSPRRARIIERLAKERGWKRGAELGVLEGHTFMHLLRSTDLDLVGVDLWKPLHDKEISYDWHDLEGYYRRLSRETAKYGERAVLLRMDTVEAAAEFEDGWFDFVFIDADHSYEGVKRDIEAWRPKARTIMGHDYQDPFPGVKRAVHEAFGKVKLYPDSVWLAV